MHEGIHVLAFVVRHLQLNDISLELPVGRKYERQGYLANLGTCPSVLLELKPALGILRHRSHAS
jgi:hypothetical protein